MEKTKVAVIGLGSIAQLVHLPNLVKMSNVNLVSVAEINSARLNTIADKFNIKERYTSYKELLEKSDIEAVIVATPTGTHKEVAVASLKSKKDVLVEKPLARSFNEAKVIVDTARKNKKKIMVGMNLRYRPDAMILKSIMGAGEIGEPFYVKCGWIRRQSSAQRWFTKKEESGGGVIVDLGISLLDLSLWLLNYPPVKSVTTQCYYQNTKNVEDTSLSFLRCKNSSVVNIETSWSLPVEKDIFYFTVYGTKGVASLNPFRIYKKIEAQFIDLTPSQAESPLSAFKKSYLNELKSFIGAVRGLNPVFSSGGQALLRQKVIDAMYQSAKQKIEIGL
ncbi:MAG: dehydrogenase [Ignavibacteria bacterium GWA2_35_9]|nr:MAG: dehydrogenase [Ignavibacteria bacterium GWA2_35_9]OGU43056.1 MAG: dehydrogenase [Ignavibacteria bacterium GWB2_36_8]OGU52233.1 MAG: dehydrogenase [Ignavibacteria bacterium GWC2_36_12]OGV03506.1 MAG: dehydrogenase [Ignavibacteria bacterium RIFOXYB2_FULL_36_7]